MSSVLFSSVIERFFLKIGRKATFAVGAVFAIMTSVAMMFLNENSKSVIYAVAVFIGGA